MSDLKSDPTGTTTAGEPELSGVDIDLVDVVKRYPGQKKAAVDGLSLHIPAGEIVMFVGPSGCGKTTSLKMINRLIEPTSGSIRIDGKDIHGQDDDELRRHIGYVIQGGSLFPHMTVTQNIALVPGLLGWDRRRTAERVDELLELVGLDPDRYRSRYPRELSGGQQQRVGVARGLAADPPVILMDEPFGAVDPITRQRLQDELLSIQEELRKTIVCVTHDFDEAVKLGDRILILTEGAKIAQYDTPEAILANPADRFVADFVGAGAALKQLTLSRVSEVELSHRTLVAVGDPAAGAMRAAQSAGDSYVVVLDDRRRPIDWLWTKDLAELDRVPGPAEGTDLVTLDRRATLNDALDTMLTSSHGCAVVTGRRDEYLGVVDFQAVLDRIQETAQPDEVPS
ncbi:MAG TPA: ABC transporter ATP-binding protein [Kribbella sp.]|uniref:ABC transporter ATP-binding protein n=1 Tax=Kribbella sp. TaxID=1871183 RepID=UPI002D79702C|nr:ABC transporter ATP-binding protein [Kribbella sp.]HET6297275.1 ABC transporter ATP-binding protein [Kribbella sp.]